MTEKSNNRTESIRLRLSPEMMERFERQADRIGLTPSTLAAFVIGRWVKEEEDKTKVQTLAVMDIARRAFPLVDPSHVEQIATAALEGVAPVVAAIEQSELAKGQE